MRTTIRLDDALLDKAKRVALERGTTLTAVIEDALRRALTTTPRSRREHVSLTTFHGDGLHAGLDLDDTASLLDVMDEPVARS